jgi:hypothetical protein
LRTAPTPISPQDIDKRLREMIAPPPDITSPDLRP